MEHTKVKIVQVNKHRWNLVAPKGHVMVEGLMFENPHKAAEWTKAYISSFQSWSYEVIPKEDK